MLSHDPKIIFFGAEGKAKPDELAKYLGVERRTFNHEFTKENPDIVWVDGCHNRNLRHASHCQKYDGFLAARISTLDYYRGTVAHANIERIDLMVYQSKHLKEYFESRYPQRPKDSIVHPLGFEIGKWPPADSSDKVALVSEVHWRKGTQYIPDFIEAHDRDVYHIGPIIDKDCWDYLNWELKRRGIKDKYHYQETTHNVSDWLQNKGYILSLSRTEGFGRAIGEAMCKGLTPLILRYRGADDLWPKVYDRVEDMSFEKKNYREFIEKNYDIEKLTKKLKKILYERA